MNLTYSSSLFTAFIAVAMLMWSGMRFRTALRARLYFYFLFTIFLYSLGQTQTSLASELQNYIFWLKVEYTGASLLPFFLFTMTFHNSFRLETDLLPPWFYFFLITPVIVLVGILGFPRFTWVYGAITYSAQFASSNMGLSFVHYYGPLFLLHQINIILALVSSFVFQCIAFFNANGRTKSNYLLQALVLLAFFIVYPLQMFDLFPVEANPLTLLLAITSPLYSFGFYSDRRLNDLFEAKSRYFAVSPNPVFIFNRKRELIDVNEAAMEAFDIERRLSLGKAWFDILEEQESRGIEIHFNEDDSGKQLHVGNHTYKYDSIVFRDGDGTVRGMLRSLYDISDLRRNLDIMAAEASFDALTGILNRRKWTEAVNARISQDIYFRQPGSLLVIDLDHFKHVNDTYGHSAGDHVLKSVAELFKTSLRELDLLGRYGGEEFVIWLGETKAENALIVAAKLRSRVEASHIEFEGQHIPVTISVGLYGVELLTNQDIDWFFTRADSALYQAKSKGRNCVVSALVE